MDAISYFQAVILGIVEGLTEFLPVSSTGHLTITEKILGLQVDDKGVTAYTAIIQMGAILAVVLFFRRDIVLIARGWFSGLAHPEHRGTLEHRMGWYVIVGSIPLGLVGFALRHVIQDHLRSLWVVAAGLILWSAVIVYAERAARQQRHERDLTMRDSIVVGLVQCFSLVPGVSRSGATISAGLLRDLDRVTATRFAFLLGIPALFAAGLYELKDVGGHGIGVGQIVVGLVISFVVAYASVAWLLRFVAGHPLTWFVPYRVLLGLVLVALLATGVLTAT